jgi:chromosome segregation ATPase
VSDTPRTDAWKWTNDPIDELYKFARQLERELNVANADVERLTKANLQLREGCEELKQRIKRLEEEIVNERNKYNLLADDVRAVIKAWNKAKEAKP